MSDKNNSKQNYIKVAIGVLLALVGAEGVDAAGYTLDPALMGTVKDFGVGGSLMLIAYLHVIAMPVARELVSLGRRIVAKLDPTLVEVEVEVEPAPAPAPAPRRATQPRLAAVKPVQE